MKIQTAALACIRPLTSAWQELLEVMVPAREVLAVIQHSFCLVGSTSEYVSQTRRTKIVETIDKSWGKFGTDEYRSRNPFQEGIPVLSFSLAVHVKECMVG